MKRFSRKRRIILLLVALVLMSGFNVNAASGKVTIKSYNTPGTIKEGKGFKIKGKISSKKKIKKVEVGIVSASTGKWTKYKYTKKGINKKSFNVKKADSKLKFGKLKPGNYYYKIKVKTSDNKKTTVVNTPFQVVSKNAGSVSVTRTATAKEAGIKLSGCTAPADYNVGKEFKTKGTLTSESKISKVEIGIVFEPTNKWTTYKYTATINGHSFDLGKAASTLKFDELPGGAFRYRMYAHTTKGVVIVFDKKFTVKPSDKPRRAVNWAINIAADDSFTYGDKPVANAIGCYFCNNNDKKVKKSGGDTRYHKTYVCLTFVGAAYAHGALDPEILKECQRCRMTMYETDDNFKKFSCWMKIGKCNELKVEDLQVGDVIIKWSDHNDNNGHVCMYIGGNNIVESSGGGWGANSIAVKSGVAASRLKSLSSSSKNYVMRYTK